MEVKEDSEDSEDSEEAEATIEEAKVGETNLDNERRLIPLPFTSSYLLDRRTAGK